MMAERMASLPGRVSLRAAINAKCRECLFDPFQPGTWRAQVEACTSPRCPLYRVRPRAEKARNQSATPRSERTLGLDAPQEKPAR